MSVVGGIILNDVLPIMLKIVRSHLLHEQEHHNMCSIRSNPVINSNVLDAGHQHCDFTMKRSCAAIFGIHHHCSEISPWVRMGAFAVLVGSTVATVDMGSEVDDGACW